MTTKRVLALLLLFSVSLNVRLYRECQWALAEAEAEQREHLKTFAQWRASLDEMNAVLHKP